MVMEDQQLLVHVQDLQHKLNPRLFLLSKSLGKTDENFQFEIQNWK